MIKYREVRNKNKSRCNSRFIHNCTLKLFDSTYGISRTTEYKCEGVGKCSLMELTSPTNLRTHEDTRGQISVLNHNLNTTAILSQFYLGVGPTTIAGALLIFDLPNAKSLPKLITKH